MMMMLDTMVVYTAFFSELQHNLGRTPQILIDFRGQEKIVILVLWTYCLANTFSGKYGSWQTIWQRQRMLDATVRTLYACLVAAIFAQQKYWCWFLTVGSWFRYFYQEMVVPRTNSSLYYIFNRVSGICMIPSLVLYDSQWYISEIHT